MSTPMSMPGSSNMSLQSNQILQRFGETRLKKELRDRGLPTTGDRSVLAVRLHNFVYPGALDVASVVHPVSSSTQDPTGEGAAGDSAAPADGENPQQAIAPLPGEQAVTFGSSDLLRRLCI